LLQNFPSFESQTRPNHVVRVPERGAAKGESGEFLPKDGEQAQVQRALVLQVPVHEVLREADARPLRDERSAAEARKQESARLAEAQQRSQGPQT